MAKQPRDLEGKFGVVHGGRSTGVRKRYSDKRTEEGRELQEILGEIVADFGGLESLSGHQVALLISIREKLKVVLPVKGWLEGKMGKIIKNDELLPVLRNGYQSWLNSYERALDRLYDTLERDRKPDKAAWIKGVTRD